jgi:hypothetical protein
MGKLAEIALAPDVDPTLAKYAILAIVRFSSTPTTWPHSLYSNIVEEVFEIASSPVNFCAFSSANFSCLRAIMVWMYRVWI